MYKIYHVVRNNGDWGGLQDRNVIATSAVEAIKEAGWGQDMKNEHIDVWAIELDERHLMISNINNFNINMSFNIVKE